LAAGRLGRAWRQLLARDGALRMPRPAGCTEAGQALIRPDLPDSWRLVEGGSLEALLEQDRLAGFDRAEGLIRLTLLRRGPEEQVLLLTNHHLLLDGWSVPVLLRELSALYRGEPLPDPFSWRQYLAWRQRQDRPAAEAWWREQLAAVEAPSRLDLPLPAAPAEGLGEAVHPL